jgi:hypothetical protein
LLALSEGSLSLFVLITEALTFGLIRYGVSPWRMAKSLVDEAIGRPYRGMDKPASQKDANRAHARLRGPGERANAQLKTWRILRKLRCCPWKAGQLAKAVHVLQAREAQG